MCGGQGEARQRSKSQQSEQQGQNFQLEGRLGRRFGMGWCCSYIPSQWRTFALFDCLCAAKVKMRLRVCCVVKFALVGHERLQSLLNLAHGTFSICVVTISLCSCLPTYVKLDCFHCAYIRCPLALCSEIYSRNASRISV